MTSRMSRPSGPAIPTALIVVALLAAMGVREGAGEPAASFRAISYDNLHIGVPDPPAAARWYVAHLGAKPATAPHRVFYGKTVLVFVKRENAGPSAGSVIDHFGLSFADPAARLESARGGGATVATGDRLGSATAAFIVDPWGVKVEIVKDPAHLGFHHVHLKLADAKAGLTWYTTMFGGETGKLQGTSGIRYDQAWILASESGGQPPVASAERAIQSVAWSVDDRDKAVAVLKGRGVKVINSGVATVDGQQTPWAYVEDGAGVRIELIQRPAESR